MALKKLGMQELKIIQQTPYLVVYFRPRSLSNKPLQMDKETNV